MGRVNKKKSSNLEMEESWERIEQIKRTLDDDENVKQVGLEQGKKEIESVRNYVGSLALLGLLTFGCAIFSLIDLSFLEDFTASTLLILVVIFFVIFGGCSYLLFDFLNKLVNKITLKGLLEKKEVELKSIEEKMNKLKEEVENSKLESNDFVCQLDKREEELDKIGEDLKRREDHLKKMEEDVDKTFEEFTKKMVEISKKEGDIGRLQNELNQREEGFNNREYSLKAREENIKLREENVKQIEENVKQRENDVRKKDENFMKRVEDLSKREFEINITEDNLDFREEDVQRREISLKEREEYLNIKEEYIKKMEGDDREREKILNQNIDSLIDVKSNFDILQDTVKFDQKINGMKVKDVFKSKIESPVVRRESKKGKEEQNIRLNLYDVKDPMIVGDFENNNMASSIQFNPFSLPLLHPPPLLPSPPILLSTTASSPTLNLINGKSIYQSLPIFEGSLCSYLCTFAGSRNVQQLLDEHPHAADILIHELIQDSLLFHIVLSDTYGNYAFQSLYKTCSEEVRESIVIKLFQKLPSIACDSRGTLSIQNMMTVSANDSHVSSIFVQALLEQCLFLMRSTHGTYCIQRMIEYYPFKLLSPLICNVLHDMESCTAFLTSFEATDLYCMCLRFIIDACCFGVRNSITSILIDNALFFCMQEYGHVLILHLLLPLMSSSVLNKATSKICMNHVVESQCMACACNEIASYGYKNVKSVELPRTCCCETFEFAQEQISFVPAFRLLNIIEPQIDSLCLNKYGKKVVLRYFSLDSKMNISPLIRRLCVSISSLNSLKRLLGDRKGVNFIIQILESLNIEFVQIFREGLRKVVQNISEDTCMGIKSTSIQLAIASEYNRNTNVVPAYVPLSILNRIKSKDISAIFQRELKSDCWIPLCISSIHMETWDNLFRVISSSPLKSLSSFSSTNFSPLNTLKKEVEENNNEEKNKLVGWLNYSTGN